MDKHEKIKRKLRKFFESNETIQIYFYPIYLLILYGMIKKDLFMTPIKYVTLSLLTRYNLIYLSLIFICTAFILLILDKPITKYFLERKEELIFYIWGKLGYIIGKGDILGAIFCIIIIIRKLLELPNELTVILELSLLSSIFAGFFVNLIKPFLTRKRPSQHLEVLKIFQFKIAIKERKLCKHDYLSMPSGHTTSIFAGMLPLVYYFHNPLFFLIAIFIAFARVIATKHWSSDVFLGMILGSTIGIYFYEYFLKYLN